MAGKIGVKQTLCLSNEQLEDLRLMLGDRFVMSQLEAASFQKRHDLSLSAVIRRANVSNRKLSAGYSWDEFKNEKNPVGKRYLTFKCVVCNRRVEMLVVKFVSRKQQEPVCKEHYFDSFVFTPEWRKRNSQAQSIAQNKTETIEKHRKNSTQMWIDGGENLRASVAQKTRERFANEAYRDAWSESAKQKWQDISYREKVIGKGKWSKTGISDGVTYASLAELAFVLWQRSIRHNVKRYDGVGISYLFMNKQHRYYPDYIVDGNIIEVKGEYWFRKNKELVETKSEACKKYCGIIGIGYRLVFSRDIPREFYKKAKEEHASKVKDI
jgi:hypothetical protein